MIKYVVTIKPSINRMRSLMGKPFDTFDEADTYLGAVKSVNSEDSLKQLFGDVDAMRVMPVECYNNGQPKGIYFPTILLIVSDLGDNWEVFIDDPDKTVNYPKTISDRGWFGIWLHNRYKSENPDLDFAIIYNDKKH